MNNNIEKLSEPRYQSIIIEINKSWERRRKFYIYIYIGKEKEVRAGNQA